MLVIIFWTILAILAIVGCVYISTCKDKEIVKKRCSKDSSKICPYTVSFQNGGMKASGHLKCCKVIGDIKKMNDFIANADPNKAYGEFSFSKEIIEEAKKYNEELKAVDSNGPIGTN